MTAREPAYMLGAEAIRELQDMAAWFRGTRRGDSPGAAEPFAKFGPRTVRWAKCMANTICTSYPSSPANVFPIRMGELDFDDTSCGYAVETFTAYDPVMDRVAFDHHNTYHHSGEIVLVFMAHGKWYVMSAEQLLARTFLAADMCPTDEDAEQLVDVTGSTYLPTCETFTPTKVVNPFHHRGPDGAKALIAKEHCQGAAEQWLVIDIEKTRYCAVIGIKDYPTCLVSAALRLAGEWCPSDEPITACTIVEYTDCTVELGSCDTSWTFDPLYACCGQAEGGPPQHPARPAETSCKIGQYYQLPRLDKYQANLFKGTLQWGSQLHGGNLVISKWLRGRSETITPRPRRYSTRVICGLIRPISGELVGR